MAEPAAAIAGIHEFEKRVAGGLSPLQIKAECAARALEDAGLTWADVDAIYDASEAGRMQGLTIAEYFGITPRVVDTTAVGGSSYEFQAAHAARDIAAGKANVALLTYGSTAHSESRAIGTGARFGSEAQPAANMERPYGLTLIGNYAMVARRHMVQYGTTPEQLAEISVTTRRHAMRNPQAVAGLTDIGQQGNHIRFSPVELPESREVRVQRLYPRTVLKPTVRTMLVPAPKADGARAQPGRSAPARSVVSLGAPPLRDQELLAWCEELIEAVLGGVSPAGQQA